MRPLDKEILAGLSVDRAFGDMEFLVNTVGERLSGTEKLRQAAEYVHKQLRGMGLEARIDIFPVYQSYPGHAEIRVVSPETRRIAARPACHIASTLPEGLRGILVYAGVGGYDDYEGLDVRGKIVLTSMTWAPPRPEKARIAEEKGAEALIIMNWGALEDPVVQMGAVKSQWGNPTPETSHNMVQIPVLSVTRAAGEYLRTLCGQGPVELWFRAEASREWVSANQPVAVLTVKGGLDEYVLVGSHLEAWGKTAICNSSGNSLVLELARGLVKRKEQLRRGVVFAFWDGHEIAEAAGSTWFVDTNWDSLSEKCVCYVNVDNPGIVGTSVPIVTSVTELKPFLTRKVTEYWGVPAEWHDAYKGGDASFFGVGVPYVSFYTGYTQQELKRLNYASLSPWLHSEADTIDRIDRALFGKHLGFFALLVTDLCNATVLPYDVVSLADRLCCDISQLEELAGTRFAAGTGGLLEKARHLREDLKKLNLQREPPVEADVARLLNRALLKVTRELSASLRSEAGRYGHDPYGYSLVGKPIPRLYGTLMRMAQLESGSEAALLWETKLLRERNRVADHLRHSADYVELIAGLVALREGGEKNEAY